MTRDASLRLVSWNLTKLAPYVADDAKPSLADIARDLGEPDILCVQEVRVRPGDTDLLARMRCALADYDCGASLCRDTKNVTFQGGRMYGVATYVKRSLAPFEHHEPTWDREGRALVTIFPGRRLALVNVYAVNGTSKPYFDHDLGRIAGDRHTYKRRFNRRLMEECLTLKSAGLSLVLVGDWNISRTRDDVTPRLRTEEPHARARRELNEVFIPKLDVVDAFRELHPDARKYTWFNARSRRLDAARVDYALVSRTLLRDITSADIDEPRRYASDHAPLTLAFTFPS